MDFKLSPEQTGKPNSTPSDELDRGVIRSNSNSTDVLIASVIAAVTRLISETMNQRTSPLNQYNKILVAGSRPDDALPDLMVLHKAELEWCFEHRWETKRTIRQSTLEGQTVVLDHGSIL